MNSKKRDISVDILKGIGIILVVIGHANCPQVLRAAIYSFHMPLFFICSGFFFSLKDVSNYKNFIQRRVLRLYIPFVKWSILFLFLHNFFYNIGLLNSEYGNISGICSDYYSWKDIIVHLINIVFRMSGYEVFLLGAYWFLRALFVGSVLLCSLTWLLRRCGVKSDISIAISAGIFCALAGAISILNFTIPYYPQGGFRDLMAASFIGCGYYIKKNSIKMESEQLKTLFLFGVIFLICFIISPSKMSKSSTILNWMLITISGVSGTIALFVLCKKIATASSALCIRNICVYAGENSFYILTFHFLMFKPAVYVYALLNNIDLRVVGCHPVYMVDNCWFWIVSAFFSVTLSLVIALLINKSAKILKMSISSIKF